ncbi:MAG: HEAT repeat domain-containing protein [Planctomycetota bacterium]
MKPLLILLLAALSLPATDRPADERPVFATWNEPWHDEVVRGSAAFVKARVIRNEDGVRVWFRRSKHLAGMDVPPVFSVDRYTRIRLQSYSTGSYPDLNFAVGEEVYLFLDRETRPPGWGLATPASAVAGISPQGVSATYRISMDQALVPPDVYERSQVAIFRHLHDEPVDRAWADEFMETWLRKPPAELVIGSAEASGDFFMQHVALELFHRLGGDEDVALLEPFLTCPTAQTRVSAVRALGRIDTEAARERLLAYLKAKSDGNSRWMAVEALRRQDARALAPRLRALLVNLDDERAGFRLNIMDPRVGTRFPSTVRDAILGLLHHWER